MKQSGGFRVSPQSHRSHGNALPNGRRAWCRGAVGHADSGAAGPVAGTPPIPYASPRVVARASGAVVFAARHTWR